jgi:transcriptional regulator with XRE-family HTH domain
MTLGQIIKQHREKAGLTQTGLAALLDTPQSRIAELEGDRGNPTLARLRAVADALGVPLWKLLKQLE